LFRVREGGTTLRPAFIRLILLDGETPYGISCYIGRATTKKFRLSASFMST
jgi:hypothetical protein